MVEATKGLIAVIGAINSNLTAMTEAEIAKAVREVRRAPRVRERAVPRQRV